MNHPLGSIEFARYFVENTSNEYVNVCWLYSNLNSFHWTLDPWGRLAETPRNVWVLVSRVPWVHLSIQAVPLCHLSSFPTYFVYLCPYRYTIIHLIHLIHDALQSALCSLLVLRHSCDFTLWSVGKVSSAGISATLCLSSDGDNGERGQETQQRSAQGFSTVSNICFRSNIFEHFSTLWGVPRTSPPSRDAPLELHHRRQLCWTASELVTSSD